MGLLHPYVIQFCDACGTPLTGEHSTGLLVFPRGDQHTYEEPPLCEQCSVAIGVTALVRWAEEEEEG